MTFHRAFDLARDPRHALDDVVTLGCARILTSGQAATATAGANLIRELVDHAAQRIVIMPGSGINAHNLADLKLKTGATEFHASAKRQLESGMRPLPDRLRDMQVGETRSDGDEIRRMLQALAGLS